MTAFSSFSQWFEQNGPIAGLVQVLGQMSIQRLTRPTGTDLHTVIPKASIIGDSNTTVMPKPARAAVAVNPLPTPNLVKSVYNFRKLFPYRKQQWQRKRRSVFVQKWWNSLSQHDRVQLTRIPTWLTN